MRADGGKIALALRRLRRRLHAAGLAQIAARLILAITAALAVAFIADRLWSLSPEARIVLMVLCGLGLISAAVAWLVRFAAMPLHERAIAEAVEYHNPDLKDCLLSAYEFTRLDEHQVSGSPVLASATCRAVASSPDALRALRFRLPNRVLLTCFAALAAVVLVAALAFRFDSTWSLFVTRFTSPYAAQEWPRATRLLFVVDGQVADKAFLRQGDGLSIEVIAEPAQPNAFRWQPPPFVHLRFGSNRVEQFSRTVRLSGQDRYRASLTQVDASGRLTAEARNAFSAALDITVPQAPRIHLLSVILDFPDYSGLADQTLAEGIGNVVAPEGTTLHLMARVSKPVRPEAAHVIIDDNNAMPLTVEPQETGSILRGRFTLQTGMARYLLSVEDLDGVPSGREPVYLLKVIEDRPPVVEIISPAQSTLRLTADAMLSLELHAADDYGVSRVELMIGETPDTPGRSVASLPAPASLTRTVRGTLVLSLAPLALAEGSGYRLWAEAADNHEPPPPRTARSRPITLEIITREKAALDSLEAEKRAREAIEQSQTAARTAADSLQAAQQAAQPSSEAAQREIAAARTALDQSLQHARAAEHILEKALHQMEINQLNRPAQKSRLREALDALGGLMAKQYPAVSEATDAARNENRSAAFNEKLDNARQATGSLQKELEDLRRRLARELPVDSLIEALQGLIEGQGELGEKTRELAASTVGKRLEELTPAERSALAAASTEQTALARRAESFAADLENWEKSSPMPADAPSPSDSFRKTAVDATLRRAAEQLAAGRPSSAATAQHEAIQNLRNLMAQLLDLRRQAESPTTLAEEIESEIERLRGLASEQEDLARSTAEGDLTKPLTQQQKALADRAQKASERIAQMTSEAPEPEKRRGSQSQSALEQAVRSMQQAAESLAADRREDAAADQEAASKALRDAITQLEEMAALDRRRSAVVAWSDLEETLGDVLRSHTSVHSALKEFGEGIAAGEVFARSDEMTLREFAGRERKMQETLNDVVAQLAPLKVPVVSHLVGRTAARMGELAERLAIPDAGPVTRHESKLILENLHTVLEVLSPLLAEARQQMQQGGTPDSAGRIVPPQQEVRLLATVENDILDATRRTDTERTLGTVHPTLLRRRLENLSQQQNDAADLVRGLLERILSPPRPEDSP